MFWFSQILPVPLRHINNRGLRAPQNNNLNMKNLSQFKTRLKEAMEFNRPLFVKGVYKTTFAEIHPFYTKYPNGVHLVEQGRETNVVRVQSNAFTTFIEKDGKKIEAWTYFDGASRWSFPDEYTAVFKESYSSLDHEHEVILTYKFL